MKSKMGTYKLGFDIGGTFTDFILLNEISGEIHTHKILTTPDAFRALEISIFLIFALA